MPELNRKVKIFDCDKLHIRSCLFDLIKYFNIEKPDYFISSLDYTNIIASLAHKCSKSKSKLVIWEHNTLSIHSKETICKYHYLNNIVIRYFYKRADRIIAVSKGVKEDLISMKGKILEIEIEKNKYKAEILIKPLNQKNFKNL